MKHQEAKIQFPIPQSRESTKTITHERINKSLLITAFALSTVIFSSVVTLACLSPLKNKQPYQLKLTQSSNATVTIEPPTDIDPLGMQIAIQKLAVDYVIKRHEITRSNTVMNERWGNPGILKMSSTPDIYAHFITGISPYLTTIREQNATVSTIITTVNVLQSWRYTRHGYYQIHYTLIGRDTNDHIIMKHNYLANIEASFGPVPHVPYALRYYNPWGFLVIGYEEKDDHSL